MGIGSVAGAFVAGVLTVLSPCVLPILPIVLGAASSERKYGPAALAAGLAVSFLAVGLFVATIGYSVGLTAELFRQIAAALMIVLGTLLLLPRLQARLAMASCFELTTLPRTISGTAWTAIDPSRPNTCIIMDLMALGLKRKMATDRGHDSRRPELTVVLAQLLRADRLELVPSHCKRLSVRILAIRMPGGGD